MFRGLVAGLMLLCGLPEAGGANLPVLNAANGFGEIRFVERADARIEGDVLKVTNIAQDHFFMRCDDDVVPGDIGEVRKKNLLHLRLHRLIA